jgi:hypothetical protein
VPDAAPQFEIVGDNTLSEEALEALARLLLDIAEQDERAAEAGQEPLSQQPERCA